MRRLAVIGSRGAVAAAVLAGGLALATGSALAGGSYRPGSSIEVSAAPVAPGGALRIKVSGKNAPATGVFAGFTYGVDLFLVYPKLLPGPCLPAENAELDLSLSNPEAVRDLTGSPLDVGKSGPFSFTYPVIVSMNPGKRIICAYDMYFSTIDAAWASSTTTVRRSATGTTKPTTTKPGAARPAAIERPSVTRQGEVLTCERGTWSGSPKSYRYEWMVAFETGVAGKTRSLPVTSKLRGHQVECSVTATSSNGSATATSRPYSVT